MQNALRARTTAAGLLALPLTCLGCISSMRVYEEGQGTTRRVAGVPFYVKVEVPRRTSVYERSWQEVTLRIERVPPNEGNAPTQRAVQVVRRQVGPEHQAALSEVVRLLNAGEQAEALKAFLELPAAIGESPGAWRVVENRVEGVVAVDHGTRYFLNAPLPWIGSSQVVPELASDGTLNKVTVEVDTQVDEAVGALAELAGGVAAFAPGPEAAATALWTGDPAPRDALRTSLEAVTVTERKTFTKTYPRGGARNELLGADNPGDGYRITRVAPAPPAGDAAPSKAYRVTGSITPPAK